MACCLGSSVLITCAFCAGLRSAWWQRELAGAVRTRDGEQHGGVLGHERGGRQALVATLLVEGEEARTNVMP